MRVLIVFFISLWLFWGLMAMIVPHPENGMGGAGTLLIFVGAAIVTAGIESLFQNRGGR